MRKVFLFSIAALLACTAAFAQIGENFFGVTGTVVFIPLEWQSTDDPDTYRDKADDFKTALGQPWGGTFGRIYFSAKGQLDLDNGSGGGYESAFLTDGGSLQIELAYVWINPFSWTSLRFGKFTDGSLQGAVGPNTFRHFVLRTYNERTNFNVEHAIFDQFRGGAGTLGGAMLSVQNIPFAPISNLSVHFLLPDVTGGINLSTEQASGGVKANAKTVFSNFVAAASYRIENVGLARLQFVGKEKIDFKGNAEMMAFGSRYYPSYLSFPRIEAAFRYTGVENILIELGAKYAIPLSGEYNIIFGNGPIKAFYNPGVMVALGVRANIGDFEVTFNGTGLFGNGYEVTGAYENKHSFGVDMRFSLIPEYTFSFGTIGMNIGLNVKGKETENNMDLTSGKIDFGAGAWYRLDLASRLSLQAGVTYTYIGIEEGDVPWLNKSSGPLYPPTGILRIPILVNINLM